MAVEASNFIESFVLEDLASGRYDHVHTRFPPEPNGYPHIGHMKAVCIDFGVAEKFGGVCNLRFDDTNPEKEDPEFVEVIQQDLRWLGFEWKGGLFFGSDYSERIYQIAERFIEKGLAYVDELTPEQMREYRGTLTTPGKNSPYRDRSVEENLDLFRRMRAGEFPDGAKVLRAKIDMASPNMNMRDPALYRIKHMPHYRTGDRWCIYPMYDFAHPLQDALEGITHSLCSMEFEAHRPLYDWVVRNADFPQPPRQIEFARINITGTVLSKRYLRRLVESGFMSGWDDPRMPTIRGMRRRGFTPEAIRDFIQRAGVAKANSVVDYALLEHCVREDLDGKTPRIMAVLEPLKVTLANVPEGEKRSLTAENHPKVPEMGSRTLTFGRRLFVERSDFMEEPVKGFFRLAPGKEVRLKNACIIRCDEVVKDEAGNVTELICTADLESFSGMEGAARKVKGTLHWVEADSAIPAQVRLYDRLLLDEEPDDGDEEEAYGRDKGADILNRVNPDSLRVLDTCYVEGSLPPVEPEWRCQFVRNGYFCLDRDSTPGRLVFNRTVSLKDSWAKVKK